MRHSIYKYQCRKFKKTFLPYLINEVGGLNRPAIWYLVTFYLNLLLFNIIHNLLPCAANVRSVPHHALKSYYANSEVISEVAMVLPIHNFGRHVAWGARCVASIFWAVRSRNTKVGNP